MKNTWALNNMEGLTYYMVQGLLRKLDSSSAGQEIPFSRNPKVHHHDGSYHEPDESSPNFHTLFT
jgi:hypothetical protein